VSTNKALALSLRRAAMDLLARREHSRAELLDKLQHRFPDAEALFAEVLEQLTADGLLDDERFCEAYVRYRRSRGAGPLLIRQELRQKGVAASTLQAALDLSAPEWLDALRALLLKKSGGSLPPASERVARQKLHRAMLAKGYPADIISRAFAAAS
jgi:regulatory protein